MRKAAYRIFTLLVFLVVSFPGFAQTIATFAGGGSPNGLSALGAPIGQPGGLVSDGAGNLYVSAQADNRVLKVDSAGRITVIAGTGQQASDGDGGPATQAHISIPTGLALDGKGNLYIAEYRGSKVRKVSLSSGIITTFAGNGGGDNIADDGKLATMAGVSLPHALACDGTYLYVATFSLIRKIALATDIIATVGGGGSTAPTNANGLPASSVNFLATVYLTSDPSGNVYVNDTNGVYRISGGVLTVLVSVFANQTSNLGNLTGLIYSNGSLYFCGYTINTNGPAANWTKTYTLMSYSLATAAIAQGSSVIATVPANPTLPGSGPLTFTLASDANSFYIGELDSTVILRMTGGVLQTMAGHASGPWADDGLPLAQAVLGYVSQAVRDSKGNFYFVDTNHNRIVRTSTAGTITTIAGSGSTVTSGDGGPATSAGLPLTYPADITPLSGIAIDEADRLYVSTVDGTVRRIDTNTGLISTVYGGGTIGGQRTDQGPAVGQPALIVQGIAYAGNGVLYAAEFPDRVVKVSLTSGTFSVFAGITGQSGVAAGDGGPATKATLGIPCGVGLDGSGNVYIADCGAALIRKVDSNGIISTFAGGGSTQAEGALASNTFFDKPYGLAFDKTAGNLFVSDGVGARVRRIDSTGRVYTVAGNGTASFSGDGGPALLSTLNFPVHLFLDPTQDVLYIGDSGNNRIRTINNLSLLTLAPAPTLSTTTLTFGSIALGARSSQTVTLTSGLAAPVTIYSVTISGANATDFQQTNNCGTAIAAGASCTITITFSPGSTGSRAASLAITDNATGSPQTVSLTGIGTTAGPAVSQGGVVNGASFAAGAALSPGSISSIFGTSLAAGTAAAASIPLPTTLLSTAVTINDVPAALYYVSPTQVNFQMPPDAATGTVRLQVVNGNLATSITTVTVAAAVPGIFFGADSSGVNRGAVLNPDYSAVTPANPAARGGAILIYCTGLGAVNPPIAAGAPGNTTVPFNNTVVTPAVSIGGQNAPVLFSAIAPGFVGLYQINVTVPNGVAAGSAVPLTIMAGGATSNTVMISLK
jgi:uncharacterized protein (TIGR03437 family)